MFFLRHEKRCCPAGSLANIHTPLPPSPQLQAAAVEAAAAPRRAPARCRLAAPLAAPAGGTRRPTWWTSGLMASGPERSANGRRRAAATRGVAGGGGQWMTTREGGDEFDLLLVAVFWFVDAGFRIHICTHARARSGVGLTKTNKEKRRPQTTPQCSCCAHHAPPAWRRGDPRPRHLAFDAMHAVARVACGWRRRCRLRSAR